MERISISRLTSFFLMIVVGYTGFCQENYYVYKKKGSPKINSDQLMQRGSLFTQADTLYLANSDYVLLVNQAGNLFEVATPNIYAFSAIADYQRKLDSNSFTKKYFSYVWKQFTNQTKRKQDAGVVYREERNVTLASPQDSVVLYLPEVRFTWQNKTDAEQVYFLLRDLETGHLIKFGLGGNTILLNVDNFILKPGQHYEWSVTVTPFPNLNELKFSSFQLLSKEEYEIQMTKMNAIVKAFTLLGFSEAEVKKAICIDYKFCF